MDSELMRIQSSVGTEPEVSFSAMISELQALNARLVDDKGYIT